MKKNRLINKLTTILAAATITMTSIALSGCSNVDSSNLVANLAADAKVNINACKYVFAENSKENNYISFLGHYDTKTHSVRGSITTYKDHQDYRITYKVSKDDYSKVVKLSSLNTGYLTQEEITTLETIVNTYDPIEVMLVETNEKETHKNFNESYRFNEEDYLNNLD